MRWFLFCLIFLVWCSQPQKIIKPEKTPTEQEIIHRAKEKVFPALVYVKPIIEEYATGRKEKAQVFASGVIVSKDGHVITNNHVVEKAVEIKCVLYNREEIGAEIIGRDPETDLAVLKLNLDEMREKIPLKVAEFGNSDSVKEGDLVMAMGAPYGYERSVSRGIISSTERYFEFSPYNLWLQTDAAINPGNSGGPLINMDGKIIGINARAELFAENIGFAIPSNIVKEVYEEIIKNGRVLRAWTGMKFQALKDFRKSIFIDASRGVLIASVEENSPASRAGIKAGDILLSCDAIQLDGLYETQLPFVHNFMAKLQIGKPVKLVALRRGKEIGLEIIPEVKQKHEGESFDCKKWDMTVKEITKFENPYPYFFKKDGVFIQATRYPGNAVNCGLQSNDIIVKIGDMEINSLTDLKNAYKKYLKLEKGKRKVIFKILRGGYTQYLVLDFELDYEKIEEER
jgi:serine protease Do